MSDSGEESYIEGLLDTVVDDETTIEYALEAEDYNSQEGIEVVNESTLVINMLKDISRKITVMDDKLSKTTSHVGIQGEKIAQLEEASKSAKKEHSRYEADIKKLTEESRENRHGLKNAENDIKGLEVFNEDLVKDVSELKASLNDLLGENRTKINMWHQLMIFAGAGGGFSAGIGALVVLFR